MHPPWVDLQHQVLLVRCVSNGEGTNGKRRIQATRELPFGETSMLYVPLLVLKGIDFTIGHVKIQIKSGGQTEGEAHSSDPSEVLVRGDLDHGGLQRPASHDAGEAPREAYG